MVSPATTPAVETEVVATPLPLVVPVPETIVVVPLLIVKVTVCPATAGTLADVLVRVAVSVVLVLPLNVGLLETLPSDVFALFTTWETALEVLPAKVPAPA